MNIFISVGNSTHDSAIELCKYTVVRVLNQEARDNDLATGQYLIVQFKLFDCTHFIDKIELTKDDIKIRVLQEDTVAEWGLVRGQDALLHILHRRRKVGGEELCRAGLPRHQGHLLQHHEVRRFRTRQEGGGRGRGAGTLFNVVKLVVNESAE